MAIKKISSTPLQDDTADQGVKPDATEDVTVMALHPIRHNGKDYGPGRPDGLTVQVSHADREQLLDAGAISAD